MKKRVLIMALTLVVTISCVTVALFSCGDKDKKKEKVKEPESKYATDVGEFEYDENTDYTNQVYLFSGIVEKAKVSERIVGIPRFELSLKSQDEKCTDLRGIGVVEVKDIESKEELSALLSKGKKIYVLCTSLRQPNDYLSDYMDIKNDKYKISCGSVTVFAADVNSIEEIDKAYESEKNKAELLDSKQYTVDEVVEGVFDSSIEVDRNLFFRGTLDSDFFVNCKKQPDLTLSKFWTDYEKTYLIGSDERKVTISITKDSEVDTENILDNPKNYGVVFAITYFNDKEFKVIIDKITE